VVSQCQKAIRSQKPPPSSIVGVPFCGFSATGRWHYRMESDNAYSPRGAESRLIQPKITMSLTSFRDATRNPQRSYQFNPSNIFLAVIAEYLIRLEA
jgi:hypothetical protein